MECPLCEHTGLDANITVCPSCKADLSAYHALDEIENSMKKQKKTLLLFIILFIIALLACVAIFFIAQSDGTAKQDKEKIVACESLVSELEAKNQQLEQEISALKSQASQLQEDKIKEQETKAPAVKEPEIKDITHVIKEGETLFLIARLHLGDGNLYPKIAEDNGIENPNIINTGDEIIIKK
ncbi:MAG: LysM peptidoglycan-binding domain-containing protein [Bacteroidota bacterium]